MTAGRNDWLAVVFTVAACVMFLAALTYAVRCSRQDSIR
jgi:hypothetical protein